MAGARLRIAFSIPCLRVTSAAPQPWHPPPSRRYTLFFRTSVSSTQPPCLATSRSRASPPHPQVHIVLPDVDQLNEAPVLSHGRVDLAVEQVADRPLQVALGRQGAEIVLRDDRDARP